MLKKRLQNRIAESKLALPLTLAYSIGVWVLVGVVGIGPSSYSANMLVLPFLAFLLITFLMASLNNIYALIRIYSRSVSCSFIVLSCTACFLFPSIECWLTQLCFATFLVVIFRTYQDRSSPGLTYFAFLCIGVGSLVAIKMLYLLPLLWLFMAFHLRSFHFRTFIASLLGVLTPYWLLMPWYVFRSDYATPIRHFSSFVDVGAPFIYDGLSVGEIATISAVVLVSLIGIVHYIHDSYRDRIRVRDYFYVLIILNFVLSLTLVLLPQSANVLLGLVIITASPLFGHFIALTSSRLSGIFFFALLLLLLSLTVFNLWTLL